jgi:hypothetical protein
MEMDVLVFMNKTDSRYGYLDNSPFAGYVDPE